MENKAKVVPFRRFKQPTSERRRFVRISEPVEAVISGTRRGGESYRFRATLGNLSAGGFYLSAPEHVEPGETVRVIVRLCVGGRKVAKAPTIAARALVRRADPQDGQSFGLAMEILDHRFL